MSNKWIKDKQNSSKATNYELDEELDDELDEEMDDEEVAKGKKRFLLGIASMGIAFAFLLLGVVFQKMGYPWGNSVTVTGFVIFGILGGILIFKNFSYAIYDEAVKTGEKYINQELHKISLADMNSVRQKFLEHKFEVQEDGWLFKKEFSVLKDSVSYCVSISEGYNIEETLNWQVDHINMDAKKGKNFCLIIFVYMDEVSEETKEFVKYYGTDMIVSESVFDPYTQVTAILVAVDKQTQEGWYMDIGKKRKISLYAYGCRLMKKYWSIIL